MYDIRSAQYNRGAVDGARNSSFAYNGTQAQTKRGGIHAARHHRGPIYYKQKATEGLVAPAILCQQHPRTLKRTRSLHTCRVCFSEGGERFGTRSQARTSQTVAGAGTYF